MEKDTMSQIPFLGGLCLLGYSLYTAWQGTYDYLLNYFVPVLVPCLIILLARYIFPEWFKEARGEIDKVNQKYKIEKKIEYVRDNHEQWIYQYKLYKQRFLVVGTIIFVLAIFAKGVIEK